MTSRYSVFPLLFLILLAIPTMAVARPGWQLVDIAISDPGEREALSRRGLDIWQSDGRTYLVYASPDDRTWLNEQGIAYAKHARPLEDFLPKANDGFLTFAEYEIELSAWETDYPAIASVTEIGRTWENRPLLLLKISDNVGTDEDEPEVLFIALQHAREWLSGMTVHGIVDHMLSNYGTDSRVTNAVDHCQLYVLLVANPDGYVYTHTTDRTWRKNRRDNGDGTFGVDLNRNFDWAWSTASGNTSSGTYRGPSPNSEPETEALIDWIEDHRGGLAACLNYHTYGQLIMYNWAYTSADPPNVEVMAPVAGLLRDEIFAVNGSVFEVGSWAQVLSYAGGGSTNDYLHAALGIPTLTLELAPDGSPGFYVAGTAIDPSVAENIPAALRFLEWVIEVRGDETPAVLSDIVVDPLTDTSVRFLFSTDEPADALIEYGTTPSLGQEYQPHRLRDLNHALELGGLQTGQTYFAKIRVENLAGRMTESEVFSFAISEVPDPVDLDVARVGTNGLLEITPARTPAGEEEFVVHFNRTGTWTEYSIDDDIPIADGEFTRIRLSSRIEPNDSAPSDTYAIRRAGGPRVLVVDGYDRWNSLGVSNGQNHSFSARHGESLAAANVGFDSCSNDAVLAGDPILGDYEAVVWMLGDESTADSTLTPAEQTLVSSYLESGGKLFVTGSEIGWDLDRVASGATQADRDFYNTYLCATYVSDDLGVYSVNGVAGALFDGLTLDFDNGTQGTYDVDYPDELQPINGATAILESAAGNVAAVAKTGTFGSGTETGQVVYIGFPFETIIGENTRDDVMQRVIDYFGINMSEAGDAWILY